MPLEILRVVSVYRYFIYLFVCEVDQFFHSMSTASTNVGLLIVLLLWHNSNGGARRQSRLSLVELLG
jgi:hypothetical protein